MKLSGAFMQRAATILASCLRSEYDPSNFQSSGYDGSCRVRDTYSRATPLHKKPGCQKHRRGSGYPAGYTPAPNRSSA